VILCLRWNGRNIAIPLFAVGRFSAIKFQQLSLSNGKVHG